MKHDLKFVFIMYKGCRGDVHAVSVSNSYSDHISMSLKMAILSFP